MTDSRMCGCTTHLGTDQHFPCSQEARPGSPDCGYHGKMREKLIEPAIGARTGMPGKGPRLERVTVTDRAGRTLFPWPA